MLKINIILINGRIGKLFAIANIISISILLLIISNTPAASSYEISLYDIYPWYFWIIASIPFILSFISIIFEFKTQYRFFSTLNILTAIMSLLILLLLPFFRGYLFYGSGDIFSHLSIINGILDKGFITIKDPYPLSHILLTYLSLVINLAPETISLIYRPMFVLCFIGLMYALSRSLKCSIGEQKLICIFSILPIIGWWLTVEYIMPSTEAFFLMPLVLYCIIRYIFNRNIENFVLSLPSLIIVPFIHIEIVIYIIICLIIILIYMYIITIFKKIKYNSIQKLISAVLFPLIFLTIMLYIWQLYDTSVSHITATVYTSLTSLTNSDEAPIQVASSGFHISLQDSLLVILYTYGSAISFIIVSGFFCIFNLYNLLKNKFDYRSILLSFIFISFIIVNIIFLYQGSLIGFHVLRQLKYTVLISILLVGLSVYHILFNFNIEKNLFKIIYGIVIIGFIILSLLCIFNLFPSYLMQTMNYQVMDSSVSSMSFFFEHRDNTLKIIEPLKRAYQNRYGDYLLGNGLVTNVRNGYSDEILPPDHFGYDVDKKFGDFYAYEVYFISYPPGEEYWQKIYPSYPSLWTFTKNDYNNLQFDYTVNNFYDNGNINLYIINNYN